ncbi:MAG: hypothetical protein ACE37F_16270 [Nannocystaceae bacterium]|nr:hypothetical protein [bacterium]
MNDERDAFRAWLDQGTPPPGAQARDAEDAWSSRGRPVRRAVLMTGALAAAVALWWFSRPTPLPATPEYQTRLLVSAADDEVRIDVGVRRRPPTDRDD